jgi:hypothetical protein
VSLTEINSLEREFLSLLDYSLIVDPEEFIATYEEIVHPALHKTCGGNFTFGVSVSVSVCIFDSSNDVSGSQREQNAILTCLIIPTTRRQ